VDEADQDPPDPASAVTNVLVAAGVKDQRSPNLAAGLLECKFVQLLVEVCNRLVAESARERARIDKLHGWIPIYSGDEGWTAYCSVAIVTCNRASGRDNGFCSVGDRWTNGLKFRVKAALDYGDFGIIFDVLGQFSRAANVERQGMLLLQCLPRKVDARLAWWLDYVSKMDNRVSASQVRVRLITCRANHEYVHIPCSSVRSERMGLLWRFNDLEIKELSRY
jgi:hypothetical protein